MPEGILIVQSRPVTPEREAEFNEWYDSTHLPDMLAVPGVVSARRYRRVALGAPDPSAHEYVAVYELDAEDLTAPIAELRRRSASGEATPSDAVQTDPPPIVSLYEALGDSAPPV